MNIFNSWQIEVKQPCTNSMQFNKLKNHYGLFVNLLTKAKLELETRILPFGYLNFFFFAVERNALSIFFTVTKKLAFKNLWRFKNFF